MSDGFIKKRVESLLIKLNSILEDIDETDELYLIKRKWFFGRTLAIEKLSLKGYKKEIYPLLLDLYKRDNIFQIDEMENCLSFYDSFPNLFEKSFRSNDKLLSYTHYELLMTIKDDDERLELERLTYKYNWDINYLISKIKDHLITR